MQASIVICGAGLAGVSAAYFLAVRQGIQDILLVDERPPLSLTSDHSTECYRNWWPDPAMVQLMNRSIDLLEELSQESGNIFQMNRRGYLYCTGDLDHLEGFIGQARSIAKSGAGPLRIHSGAPGDPVYMPAAPDGFLHQPDGADLLLGREILAAHYPHISKQTCAALHVRRAGWLSAQQLGMYLLEQSRRSGVILVAGKVCHVETSGGQVSEIRLEDGRRIKANRFVNAAGPYLKDVGNMLGVDLPVYNELHLKLAIQDSLGVLDREAPLVIWSDPQRLDWSSEETAYLLESPEARALLEILPAGVHARPEGGKGSQIILALWEYISRLSEPVYPIFEDPLYPEVVLRGLTRLLPAALRYVERIPRPRLDGGYYTRTPENRPLIGPLPVGGAYVIGALSGFGVMSACAAGDLLASWIAGEALPDYSAAFAPDRYSDPAYFSMMEKLQGSGQL